jgi:hypothetical protein
MLILDSYRYLVLTEIIDVLMSISWEPKPTVWQGHCGLAPFWQGQNLQVHHVSVVVGRNAKWFPLTEKKFILSQGNWQ